MPVLACIAASALLCVASALITRPVRGERRTGLPFARPESAADSSLPTLTQIAERPDLSSSLRVPSATPLPSSGLHSYMSYGQCMGRALVREMADFWGGAYSGDVRFLAHADLPWSNVTLLFIGGNIGHDVDHFLARYSPKDIIIFEPVPHLAQGLVNKFGNRTNVKVLPFGLDNMHGSMRLFLAGAIEEGSSAYFSEAEASSEGFIPVQVEMRRLSDILRATRQREGEHLMISMNCEGCEFGVMEDLLDVLDPFTGLPLITRVHTLQYGLHWLAALEEKKTRYCRLHEALQRYYRLTYAYPWWWESWTLDLPVWR